MAKLTIELELDNAAFEPEPGPEVARILAYLADTFRGTLVIAPRGPEPMALRDINGNTVGQVTIIS
ncbi:hypothetical protein LCGC14_1313140 [marine sediment metagenome]|uniref:Uncharacterized protein n=1 Tax=marine sediment metagenome TaxID=412755 RepID=A0A0F9L6V0_9ZZZZ